MALVLESIKKEQEKNIMESLVKQQEIKGQIRKLLDMEKTLTHMIERAMGASEALINRDGDTLTADHLEDHGEIRGDASGHEYFAVNLRTQEERDDS